VKQVSFDEGCAGKGRAAANATAQPHRRWMDEL